MVYFFHRNFDQLKQLARHGCDYKREWKIAVTHFTRENSVSTCSDHEGSHKFQTTAKKKSLLRVGKNSTFPQGKTANCCHFSERCEFCFIWSQKSSWVFSLLGFSIPGVCGEVRAWGGGGALWGEAGAGHSQFQPVPAAPQQGTAEPLSQAVSASVKAYLSKGKAPLRGWGVRKKAWETALWPPVLEKEVEEEVLEPRSMVWMGWELPSTGQQVPSHLSSEVMQMSFCCLLVTSHSKIHLK